MDVSYIDDDGSSLYFSDREYNNSRRVVRGSGIPGNGLQLMRVALTPLNGDEIGLNSFDLGELKRDLPGRASRVELNVYEIGSSSALFTYVGVSNHFSDPSFSSIVSSTGFFIDWDVGAFGLDNVDFTISAIPLPAAVWLFGTAFAGLGFLRRVRRN